MPVSEELAAIDENPLDVDSAVAADLRFVSCVEKLVSVDVAESTSDSLFEMSVSGWLAMETSCVMRPDESKPERPEMLGDAMRFSTLCCGGISAYEWLYGFVEALLQSRSKKASELNQNPHTIVEVRFSPADQRLGDSSLGTLRAERTSVSELWFRG
jgi:hypothetical protein